MYKFVLVFLCAILTENMCRRTLTDVKHYPGLSLNLTRLYDAVNRIDAEREIYSKLWVERMRKGVRSYLYCNYPKSHYHEHELLNITIFFNYMHLHGIPQRLYPNERECLRETYAQLPKSPRLLKGRSTKVVLKNGHYQEYLTVQQQHNKMEQFLKVFTTKVFNKNSQLLHASSDYINLASYQNVQFHSKKGFLLSDWKEKFMEKRYPALINHKHGVIKNYKIWSWTMHLKDDMLFFRNEKNGQYLCADDDKYDAANRYVYTVKGMNMADADFDKCLWIVEDWYALVNANNDNGIDAV